MLSLSVRNRKEWSLLLTLWLLLHLENILGLSVNQADMKGTFVSVPERDQIPENIQERLIVELYSK